MIVHLSEMYRANYHYRGAVEVSYLAARAVCYNRIILLPYHFLTCFNHFCYREKANSGGDDISEEAIKKLSTRPEIKIPDAGPKAAKVTTAAAAPS